VLEWIGRQAPPSVIQFATGHPLSFTLDRMTTLYLPAGTDVAEMALFDVDAIPRSLPRDESAFGQLAFDERLIRFPTGADGGYLLHLFVNEQIPTDIEGYCLKDDRLVGGFYTSEGRIAFGGIESAYAEFKPNPYIRSDGLIEPGRYAYTAYRTEFPDELVMQAVRVERTSAERWLGRAPLLAALAHIAIAFAFAVARQFVLTGLVLVGCYIVVKFLLRRPAYQALVARRERAQLAFPSMVVELVSNSSLKPTPDGAA
jgi:hypothetical protein